MTLLFHTDSSTTATAGYSEANPAYPGLASVSVKSPFMFPRPTDDQVREAKIVIVDDQHYVAAVIEKQLRGVGFRNIEIVVDSSKAHLQIATAQPDVVLLDLNMQPVSGWQLLDSLRRDDRTQHIPILIQTADTDERTRIDAFNLGAHDFINKPVVPTELIARVRNTLAAKVYRDRMTQYSLQLEFDVLTDGLTGIANRRAFDYELRRRFVDWHRQRNPLCVVLFDLDHFKAVNDNYGHQAGDAALIEVANILKHSVRELDLVARFGGEEFAMILPYSTTADGRVVAERARASIAAKTVETSQHRFKMTTSIGIAEVSDGDDAEMLIRRADTALYRAKKAGRNRSFYNDGKACNPVLEDGHSVTGSSVMPDASGGDPKSNLLEQKRIAIVDDEPHIIAIVRKYLRDVGYLNFTTVTDSTEAMTVLRAEVPDLILLDIRMPKIGGLEILQQIREDKLLKAIPVLIFTSATDVETKVQALELGASDYCEKPLNVAELRARVRNTLMAKAHVDSLSDYSNQLESQVAQRTSELAESRREAIHCLARAAEMRDDNTGRHIIRVGRYAAIIASELGFGHERIVWLEQAAQLHDVGKIGISDGILLKPGALTKEEFSAMQRHCVFGSRIIRNTPTLELSRDHDGATHASVDSLRSPLMRMAAVIAETHHERWDGTGYPRGLKAEQIPIEGRITAVADVFDALSSARPYKNAMPLDQCFTILSENRGSHFDPMVLDAFFRRKSEIVRTFHEYCDNEALPASVDAAQ